MTLEYARPVEPVKPGVLTWFSVYSLLMAVMYLILAIGGAYFLSSGASGNSPSVEGGVFLGVGAPLAVAFGMAPFLPRRPWVWIYDIVLICIGLTSVCIMPASIPLLIFWLKPNTKLWFGRG